MTEIEDFEQEDDYGFIYILSNEATPNDYKVGLTRNTVEHRVRQLSSSTAISLPYVAQKVFRVRSDDLHPIEQRAHKKLKVLGLHRGKEYFNATLKQCVEAVEEAIFEVTGTTTPELIGQAKERLLVAAEKAAEENERKQRHLKTTQHVSEQVEKLRINYVAKAIRNKPFLEKYIATPFIWLSALLLDAVVSSAAGQDFGLLGWVVPTLILYWHWRTEKQREYEKYYLEAITMYPDRTLMGIENPTEFTCPSCKKKCRVFLEIAIKRSIRITCPSCATKWQHSVANSQDLPRF